jgi:hypothetical protein
MSVCEGSPMGEISEADLTVFAEDDARLYKRYYRWEDDRKGLSLLVGFVALIAVDVVTGVFGWNAVACFSLGYATWFGCGALSAKAKRDRIALHKRLHKHQENCPLGSVRCPIRN